MLELLKNKLYDQKGSIERVLVTILLLIIGVGLFIGLSSWLTTKNSEMTDIATIKIEQAKSDSSN